MRAPMDKGTAFRLAEMFNTVDEIRRRINLAIESRAKEGFYVLIYLRRHANEVEALKPFEKAGYFIKATSIQGLPAYQIEWGDDV